MLDIEWFYTDILHVQDKKLVKELVKITNYVNLRKGKILIHEGEVQNHFDFLMEGILRGFFFNVNGREVTDCFAFRPGTAIMASVASGEPALFGIEAMTDCNLLQIEGDKMLAIMHQEPQLLWIYNKLLEQSLKEHWTIKTVMCQYTAMERYHRFLKEYPGLINQIINKYMASYLGMAPVTLSRLRRELRENSEDKPEAPTNNAFS